MIINYYQSGKLYSIVLPEKPHGYYRIDEGFRVHPFVEIDGVETEWWLRINNSNYYLITENGSVSQTVLETKTTYHICNTNEDMDSLLYCEPASMDRQSYVKYAITGADITIGRSSENLIQFDNEYISNRHAILRIVNKRVHIEDLDSRNGTYVNGVRVHEMDLDIGDVIYLLGFKIIIGPGFIEINNPDGLVYTNDKVLKRYRYQYNSTANSLEKVFYRSPRFTRKVETTRLIVEGPPDRQEDNEVPMVFVLGPSITMGMASVATAAFSVTTAMANGSIKTAIPSLIMASSMVLGTVLWPIISKKFDRRRKRRKEKERVEKYGIYLEKLEESIRKETEEQTHILQDNSIDLNICNSRINGCERKLWERSIHQDDLLNLRVGTGNVPLNVEFEYPKRTFSLESDELREHMLEICERRYMLKNVPVEFSFVKDAFTGVVGNCKYVESFIKGLLLEIVTLYSYRDVKICMLYNQEGCDFVRWLPHVWDKEHTNRLLATSKDEVKELSIYLDNEFERCMTDDNKLVMLEDCRYVIICMDMDLARRCDALTKIQKTSYCGFSVIYGYNRIAELPDSCTAVFELDKEKGSIYNREVRSNEHQEFSTSMAVNYDITPLCKKLSNIYLCENGAENQLPRMINFLDMYQVSKIEHLNILQRWKESNPVNTLEAPIGIDIYGDIAKLNLHEKYHGPHGLIAGMTGSGKSEFIMTYILSLAVNYHPNEVSFILIDYKGGGMAKAFDRLPHTAGIITNLDGSAVNRSLISIQSELMRRQALFGETAKRVGVSNIDIYKYQQMYRSGEVEIPLSHLFIISDEFAELKMQQPEFMKQLMSASRIGRSLGVHLILATQKPAGVVDDQIWSNSRFHVCLKVQDRSDSMDMLKRPEAASLKETGRYYLQVGYDECFEMGQSAWSGDAYNPMDEEAEERKQTVEIIDTCGHIVKSSSLALGKSSSGYMGKQLDCIVEHIQMIADDEGLSADKLWLEPLQNFTMYDELWSKYCLESNNKLVLCPLIGELDDPRNQAKRELYLPLTAKGNTVIYGMAGSGKTTLLFTILYSLISQHNPEELELYIMDFASETLGAFRNAPQVKDVIYMADEDKMSCLFTYLQNVVSERKTILAESGGSIERYNETHENLMKNIVVILHNYITFREEYEAYETILARVAREGEKYGVYFVLTAMADGEIRARVQQTMKQVIVLQLNDALEYTMILGRTGGMIPSEIPGRGLVREDGELYEVQCALITTVNKLFEYVEEYCESYLACWSENHVEEVVNYIDTDSEDNIEKHANETKNIYSADLLEPETIDYDEVREACLSSSTKLILSQNDEAVKFAEKMLQNIKNENIYLINADKSAKTIIQKVYKLWKENNQHRIVVCIIQYHELVTQYLDVEQIHMLGEMLDGDSPNIIIADNYDLFKPHYYAEWCEKRISGKDGVWIGEGYMQQYIIKTNPSVIYQLKSNDSYYVVNGVLYTIRREEPCG